MNSIEITVKELERYDPDDVIILDIRGTEAFKRGHIDRAVAAPPDLIAYLDDWDVEENISEDILRSLQASEGISHEKTIVLYCQYGENSISAAETLRESGLDAYSLKGGFLEWIRNMNSEMERYNRQIILPELGYKGQQILKNSKVLIIGAGGLGSPAALYLAGAGVGTLGIVDADKVSLDNLHRQIIHKTESIGVLKTDSAKETLEKLNPAVRIKTYPFMITPENISDIISEYDFIIDAVDRFETKFLINDACVLAGKPFCHGGILQFTGQAMTYVPGKGPCYRCIFEEIPESGSIPTCSEAGVIGAVCGIIGSVQALEAIKYLISEGQLLTGRMFVFDGLNMKSRIALFPESSEDCRVCGKHKNILNVIDNKKEYTTACKGSGPVTY